MTRSRLTHEDAMTLWRARDVYRVQSFFRGIVALVFLLEFVGYYAGGYWWLGLLTIALQWAAFRCLCWALRWVRQGVWWTIDHGQDAVRNW
jgi:hypothetical protein